MTVAPRIFMSADAWRDKKWISAASRRENAVDASCGELIWVGGCDASCGEFGLGDMMVVSRLSIGK